MNAAGAWGRKSDQGVAAIGGDNWLAEFYFVVVKVAYVQKTAVLLHPFRDCLCEWPAIKPSNPVFCNLSVRKRQLWLLENVSLDDGMDTFKEHFAGRVEARHLMLDGFQAKSIG